MQYEYFYGAQAEQFSFYRIPKALFTEPNFRELSTDAKVLYGILLDRMSLSLKNQWLDAQNKVYIIFTVEEIMDALNCANQKATRLMVELEKQAGLIERKRQGLGRPNLIYVKNFAATIIDMVDANIQREHISPMEKARAYAMKLEAISHQGERRQETSNQVGWKLESAHEVGQQAGDSGTQVRRYVRLNSLVPDLQKKVDSGTLKFNPAVELSYLTPDEQQSFLDYAEAQDCTPSLSQAQKLKAASKEGNLTLDKLEEIMLAQKPSVAPREPVLNINVSKVAQYFPTGCTKQQMENRILKILESYFRQMAHEQAHEEER